MTTFDPLDTARDVLVSTKLTDPDAIADEVLSRTPRNGLRAAYRLLLRRLALDAIRFANMSASEPRRTPNRSSKVAAIRNRHIDYFAQRVCANGEWKMLGDCTPEDVLDLAAQRREVAARNAAKAGEYEALHSQMIAAGVARARDLGEVAA